eukprot:4936649-Pleurochrysis_carterae.AAC.4
MCDPDLQSGDEAAHRRLRGHPCASTQKRTDRMRVGQALTATYGRGGRSQLARAARSADSRLDASA